jgi:hypothetical protein
VSEKFFEEQKRSSVSEENGTKAGERERERESEREEERNDRESHIPSGSRMLIETLRNGVRRTAKSRLRRELVV